MTSALEAKQIPMEEIRFLHQSTVSATVGTAQSRGCMWLGDSEKERGRRGGVEKSRKTARALACPMIYRLLERGNTAGSFGESRPNFPTGREVPRGTHASINNARRVLVTGRHCT
jgi:hypothetical protein